MGPLVKRRAPWTSHCSCCHETYRSVCPTGRRYTWIVSPELRCPATRRAARSSQSRGATGGVTALARGWPKGTLANKAMKAKTKSRQARTGRPAPRTGRFRCAGSCRRQSTDLARSRPWRQCDRAENRERPHPPVTSLAVGIRRLASPDYNRRNAVRRLPPLNLTVDARPPSKQTAMRSLPRSVRRTLS